MTIDELLWNTNDFMLSASGIKTSGQIVNDGKGISRTDLSSSESFITTWSETNLVVISYIRRKNINEETEMERAQKILSENEKLFSLKAEISIFCFLGVPHLSVTVDDGPPKYLNPWMEEISLYFKRKFLTLFIVYSYINQLQTFIKIEAKSTNSSCRVQLRDIEGC